MPHAGKHVAPHERQFGGHPLGERGEFRVPRSAEDERRDADAWKGGPIAGLCPEPQAPQRESKPARIPGETPQSECVLHLSGQSPHASKQRQCLPRLDEGTHALGFDAGRKRLVLSTALSAVATAAKPW